MQKFLVSLVVGFSASAFADIDFSTSAADLKQVLANPVFERYGKFAIDTTKRGEIAQAEAYFIRLSFPADRAQKGVCLEFISKDKSWELAGQPYACEE